MSYSALPVRISVIVAIVALVLPLQAHAQGTWPERPIRLIVPFAPGASTDNVARMLALRLSPRLGQSVVVDNRGGAGGIIGIETVAKARPDGYTLLFASNTVVTNAAAEGRKLPYDPVKDLAPIGEAGSVPFMIVVPEIVRAATLSDFIAQARAKPKSMSYGTGGVGTITHLATELFAYSAKIELLHVPYKGVGAAVPDLLAGRLQVLLFTVAAGTPHVRSGKVRGLAVTSTQRSPLVPELPTASEAGLPGFQVEAWWGLLGPARLSGPLVKRLSDELNAVLVSPDFREMLAREGATARAGTPESFRNLMRSELTRWSRLITEANIQME
jgi:tripartite-type tricarboxylate transporter receptor subunit TctC